MGILNFKTKKQNLIEIRNGSLIDDCQYKFSNCLISGIKSAGRDALMRSLIVDSINDSKAIFVIQNGNALPNNTIRDEFAVSSGSRDYFCLDFTKQYYTEHINFFKEAKIDFVKELLLLLMTSYKDMTQDSKNFAERYLNEVFELLQYALPPVKKFKLENFDEFDRDWITDEANRLHAAGKIDVKKRDNSLKYANNLSLFVKELYELENFFAEVKKQNFAKLLSGDIAYSKLNSDSKINFFVLDHISCAKQSKAFLKLFIHKAICEMQTAKIDTTFIFEDVDIFAVEEFREVLKACNSKANNNVYFTVDKITNINNVSFDPRAYCNSYFVFKQSIKSEADEWANTSGTYKKDKATKTTSSYNQVHGKDNTGFLGAMANIFYGNKQVVTATNHEIIDEHNVAPSVFMNLDLSTSQAIINSDSGKKYIKQIKWA